MDVRCYNFGYAAVDSILLVAVKVGAAGACLSDSVLCLVDWNHRMKCGTSYAGVRLIKTPRPA
jgi:hypothetical protein